MVGSYWKVVIKRAWRRSLELVRLESWERIVVFLIALLIPALAAWFFVGDTASATVRALATLGGAAIGAALMFGWGLIKLPAVMAAESEAEKQRLAYQIETQEQIKARREALGELLISANQIARAYTTAGVELQPVIEAANEWGERAQDLAGIHLDGAHQALLWSDTGILMGEPTLLEDRMGRWRWMAYRAFRLQQIISSL